MATRSLLIDHPPQRAGLAHEYQANVRAGMRRVLASPISEPETEVSIAIIHDEHGRTKYQFTSESLEAIRITVLAEMQQKKPVSNDVLRIFRQFDANNSGDIDVDELTLALNALGLTASGSQAQSILQRYAPPGRFALTFSEFKAFVEELRAFQGRQTTVPAGSVSATSRAAQTDANAYFEEARAPPPRDISEEGTSVSEEVRHVAQSRQGVSEADMQDAFRKHDPENVGLIDTASVGLALSALGVHAHGESASHVKDFLASRGADRSDGDRLEYAEFRQLVLGLRTMAREAEVRSAFRRFDTDGSGDVDAAELWTLLSQLGVPREPRAERVMSKYVHGGALRYSDFTLLLRELGVLAGDSIDAMLALDGPAHWRLARGDVLEPALQGDEPAVRLLDAHWLISEADKRPNAKLVRRQDLPAAAFVDLPTLKQCCGYALPIVCLSYCWLRPDHPDPHGEQLQIVARLLRSRLAHKTAQTAVGSPAPRIGVFWDFASLCQHGASQPRTDKENELFRQGLKSLGALYGHERTFVFRLTSYPAGYPKSYELPAFITFSLTLNGSVHGTLDDAQKVSLQENIARASPAARAAGVNASAVGLDVLAGGIVVCVKITVADASYKEVIADELGNLLNTAQAAAYALETDVLAISKPIASPFQVCSYGDRGWPFTETAWSQLSKPYDMSFDIGKLDASFEQWPTSWKGISSACCKGARPPPRLPSDFEAEMSGQNGTKPKIFTNGKEDHPQTIRLYSDSFHQQLGAATVLRYSALGWDDADAMKLAKVIRSGALLSVQSIFLTRNRIGDAGRAALTAAIATRAAPCLSHCWLTETIDLARPAIAVGPPSQSPPEVVVAAPPEAAVAASADAYGGATAMVDAHIDAAQKVGRVVVP